MAKRAPNQLERDKTFDKLVSENATCLEFALNGFLRIYEKGEKLCECASCLLKMAQDEKSQ